MAIPSSRPSPPDTVSCSSGLLCFSHISVITRLPCSLHSCHPDQVLLTFFSQPCN